MNPKTDVERFANAFGTMCEVFEKQSSPIIVKAYFKAMENFDIGQVEKAIWDSISTCKFFPKPIELITIIIGGEPKSEDNASAQVNEIMRQIREIGSYRTPTFGDPVTESLMKSRWSWQAVCAMTQTEHKWFAKEFIEAYQSFERTDQPMIEDRTAKQRLRLLAGGIGR